MGPSVPSEDRWEGETSLSQAFPTVCVSTSLNVVTTLRFVLILNSPGFLGGGLQFAWLWSRGETSYTFPTMSNTSPVFTRWRRQHGLLPFWRRPFFQPQSEAWLLVSGQETSDELYPCILLWFVQIVRIWPASGPPFHVTQTAGIRPAWVQLPSPPLPSCVLQHSDMLANLPPRSGDDNSSYLISYGENGVRT